MKTEEERRKLFKQKQDWNTGVIMAMTYSVETLRGTAMIAGFDYGLTLLDQSNEQFRDLYENNSN